MTGEGICLCGHDADEHEMVKVEGAEHGFLGRCIHMTDVWETPFREGKRRCACDKFFRVERLNGSDNVVGAA